MELSMLIKRCLTYGVKIYPFQLNSVLRQYELKKVSDEKLELFDAEQMNKYVKALCLCDEEMANEWTKGHAILKELGFEEIERKEGMRVFVSLIFNNSFKPTGF